MNFKPGDLVIINKEIYGSSSEFEGHVLIILLINQTTYPILAKTVGEDCTGYFYPNELINITNPLTKVLYL